MKAKKNLRITALYSVLAVIVLLGVSMFTQVSAQAVIPSVFPDNFVGPVGYPNSSTIDYSNYYCGWPKPQLTAMVSDGGPGGPPPFLFTNDRIPPFWFTTPLPAPPGCSPDVVIGNDMTACGNYIVAVVATVPCGTGTGKNVMLYVYSITGPPPFPAPVPIGVYNISGCSATGPAHIDIFDHYSNLVGNAGCTPLAFANQFIITWQDPVKGIMGYYASLNNPTGGTPVVINPNPNLSTPDVAGVERQRCSGFEDYGLFTFVDRSVFPNLLYYQEWEIPLGVAGIGPTTLYDNTMGFVSAPGGPPGFISYERIDAIDDYHFNAPGGGNAFFDIVAAKFINAAVPDIFEYNNITGPLVATPVASPVLPTPPAFSFVPQVTCGPGQKYTVTYFSVNTFPVGAYYATGIDWGTGLPTGAGDAYQINLAGFLMSPGWPYGVAVSGSHNIDVCGGVPSQETFTGYESSGSLWEKYSANPCFPYSFKPLIKPIPTSNEWQVVPNPTSDNITLIAPAGFAIDDNTTYSITDLSGKAMQQSKVGSASEQVNVKNLPSGMYMININSKDGTTKTIKFVKD